MTNDENKANQRFVQGLTTQHKRNQEKQMQYITPRKPDNQKLSYVITMSDGFQESRKHEYVADEGDCLTVFSWEVEDED